MIYYKAVRIFTGSEWVTNRALLVEDGVILDVVPDNNQYPDAQVIDFGEQLLVPAFIDLQIYGGNGNLFTMRPTAETIQQTYEEICQQGTAFFQITLSTSSLDRMIQAIHACKEYQQQGGKGLIGLHLEGPYINPEKKGAHLEQFVRRPTPAELNSLFREGEGIITCITFAPEVVDEDCFKLLLQSGIRLSIGHSNATYAQARSAMQQGVRNVTHLFNAMSQLQSRAAGIVGACYDSDVYASIIADGIHVSYDALSISKKIMKERLYYISDAVTHSSTDEYSFVRNDDHYVTTQGVLAGSALSMYQSVKNGVEKADISWEESLRMASLYPARVAGLDHCLGKLEKGYQAEFAVFELDHHM